MRSPYVRLLDVDPALGAGLEQHARDDARRLAVVPVVTLPRGCWSDEALLRRIGKPCRFGCLVLDGLIAHEVVLQDRTATELLGKGDLLVPALPDGAMLGDRYFGVTDTASLAVLDALPALTQRWPAIATALLLRAERQCERVTIHQAISQLRRAEDRVLALFWHLGARWGSDLDGDVIVPLALSHDAIAKLVGGSRPTISVALGRLAGEGLLTRRSDGTWRLADRSRTLVVASAMPSAPPDARLIPAHGRALDDLAEAVDAEPHGA
jgi:DNA-binding transcriptional ArsR family regulator